MTVREARDLARAVVGPWAPFAIAALSASRGLAGVAALRLGAVVAGMALGDWLADRPALDPLSYAALRLADESTRGVGIWLGCVRARDFRALLPRRPPPAGDASSSGSRRIRARNFVRFLITPISLRRTMSDRCAMETKDDVEAVRVRSRR